MMGCPVASVHPLMWEDAQLAAGFDPDFHRRDLADVIEAGAFPKWELGHQGVTPYLPNSLDDDLPSRATEPERGYVTVPTTVVGEKLRGSPASFDDHFSQARMLWLSLTPLEQDHVVDAYTFELAKCYQQAIKERTLRRLADIDVGLCERVAAGLGLPAPKGHTVAGVELSPILSLVTNDPGPILGRVFGVVAGPGADVLGIAALRKFLKAEGAVLKVIAVTGGTLGSGKGAQVIERTLFTKRPVEFDAVLIARGSAGLRDPRLTVLLQEAFRHCKVVGAWGRRRPGPHQRRGRHHRPGSAGRNRN